MKRIAPVVGILLVACLLGSPPASAVPGPATQPTPEQMANAAGRMLTWEDVPRSMKVAPGWEFTVKADKGLAHELCTKGGTAILAPAASALYQVELGETDLQSDPVAFQQNVWQYSDSTAAGRAWATLQQRARKCTGRSVERAPGESSNVQYLTNGSTEVDFDGRQGVWVQSRFARPVTENATTEGGYYVMFLNGDVIQSVEYDYPDTVDLSGALRSQVQQIAVTLATRWISPAS